MIKKLLKKIYSFLLSLFNLFYIPYLYSFYKEKLADLSDDTQIFLMSRLDFGTYIYMFHYARCWEEKRGKTCVVVLNPELKSATELAKAISPNSILIIPNHFILRFANKHFKKKHPHLIYNRIFLPIYFRLYGETPHALRLFDPTLRSCYIPFFDHRSKKSCSAFSEDFCNCYKEIRKHLNFYNEGLIDALNLHIQCGLKKRRILNQAIDTLKKSLGIQEKFVVINLNCKTYKEKGAVRKTVNYPERYNCIIDLLIEREFTVVIQGREEQYHFKPRKGLVNYSQSHFCSIENDLALYSACHFAILNKTGPESFTTVCNTPLLGLDYSELCNVIFNVKLRFYPKLVKDKKTDRILNWKESLTSPSFYDIGKFNFDPSIEFIDIEEEDLLRAVEEFIPLVSQPDEKWLQYSPEQLDYKKFLHPMHLDLYDVKSVPCIAYLKKTAID